MFIDVECSREAGSVQLFYAQPYVYVSGSVSDSAFRISDLSIPTLDSRIDNSLLGHTAGFKIIPFRFPVSYRFKSILENSILRWNGTALATRITTAVETRCNVCHTHTFTIVRNREREVLGTVEYSGIPFLCIRCRKCVDSHLNNGCCQCEHAVTRYILTRNPCGIDFDHLESKLSPRHPTLQNTIGVEYELAGFLKPTQHALNALYETCVAWNTAIGTDGSVMAADTTTQGVELRTSPARGTRFLLQHHTLGSALRKANAVVNASCGLHVHIGLRKLQEALTLTQHEPGSNIDSERGFLGYVAAVWAKTNLQSEFYALVDNSRQDNTYCSRLRIHDIGDKLLTVKPFGTDASVFVNLMVLATGTRYLGLNLQAYAKYKTLEFRLHHGTTDPNVVIPWGLLCSAFVQIASRMYFNNTPISMLVEHTDMFKMKSFPSIRALLSLGAVQSPYIEQYLNAKTSPKFVHYLSRHTRKLARKGRCR